MLLNEWLYQALPSRNDGDHEVLDMKFTHKRYRDQWDKLIHLFLGVIEELHSCAGGTYLHLQQNVINPKLRVDGTLDERRLLYFENKKLYDDTIDAVESCFNEHWDTISYAFKRWTDYGAWLWKFITDIEGSQLPLFSHRSNFIAHSGKCGRVMLKLGPTQVGRKFIAAQFLMGKNHDRWPELDFIVDKWTNSHLDPYFLTIQQYKTIVWGKPLGG